MGDKSDVTLTISSLTDKTTPSDQINHLSGQLHGNGVLKVVGNGQYDEGVDADLTIHGSQSNFYGDLVLENGAWVDIEANSEGLFGNEGAANDVVLSKKSRLTIESSQSGPASFHGVFKDGTDGGGTVEISLNGSDDHSALPMLRLKRSLRVPLLLTTGRFPTTISLRRTLVREIRLLKQRLL